MNIFGQLLGPLALLSLLMTPCVVESESEANMAEKKTVTVERATRPLRITKFAKLGIVITLPEDAINKCVEDGRSWRDTYGCRTVRFALARVPMTQFNRGDLNAMAGHVNIYTASQYAQWTRSPSALLEGGELILRCGKWTWTEADEQFDVLRGCDSGTNAWGMTQITYRIDRKAEDGRVLQAMITRMDYTDDAIIKEQDLSAITNILNSVQFID